MHKVPSVVSVPANVNRQGGFTLIELMIVVGIVAVLAMVAVPAYQDYTVRAKMSEVMGFLAKDKASLGEYRQTVGSWPADINAAGISSGARGNYIDSTAYDATTGTLTYTLNNTSTGLDTKAIKLVPTVNNSDGTITWDCQPDTVASGDLKYLPAECRS